MAKNKLSDLNDHLFAQLERLNEENLTPEQIKSEVARAKAITGISSQVVNNARVQLEAIRMVSTGDSRVDELPEGFGVSSLKISKGNKP